MLLDLKPLDLRPLFKPLTRLLLRLLKGLPPEAWYAPTCYPCWKVRDIAAHLIQTAAARLSRQRDDFPAERNPGFVEFDAVVPLIAESNAAWEKSFSRISPRVVFSLLTITETQLARFVQGLDPDAEAPYAVGWAGERVSANWFDIAREYTERWHHQQQIREAAGAPSLERKKYLAPVLATLIRCLPFWYRETGAEEDTGIQITITGASGGCWTLCFRQGKWLLFSGRTGTGPQAAISLDQRTAWKFLTRSLPPQEAAAGIRLEGNPALTGPFLKARGIMMGD